MDSKPTGCELRRTCDWNTTTYPIPNFFLTPLRLHDNVTTDLQRIELSLQSCAARHAPDQRVAVFDVEASVEDGELTVAGTVQSDDLAERVREWTADLGVETYDLAVCDDLETERTIAEPVVPVRGDPESDAEQVTQCLYGMAVSASDERGAWTRVRVPDGYVGWVRTETLAEPAGIDPDAVLREDLTDDEDEVALYAGTECRVDGEEGHDLVVTFRTGETRRVPADLVRSNPATPTGELIVETARQFLGTEYLWGGMTTDGIDCSGLVWTAHHLHGVTLPRDADQQRGMGRTVERDDLRPGDLLFFPGHVAISLGGDEYVHAYGGAEGVVVNSFDPDDDRYVADLDEGLELARRLFGE